MQPFRILGICGSLRQGSYNRGLLRAARQVLPQGAALDIVELGDIPHFNADVLAAGEPPVVLGFKTRIREADALLIATPNNYSIPGVLKNALDWASRPNKASVLKGKPVGIIGASTGEGSTVRAQLAYVGPGAAARWPCSSLNSRVPFAAQKFDDRGELTDEDTRRRLAAFLVALVEWARLVTPR